MRTVSALGLCFTLLILGCANQQDDKIRIGAIIDQTGPIAWYGNWTLRGMRLAIDEVNNKGGIGGRQLELIVEDGRSNPAAAISALYKISAQGMPVVLMGTGSSAILAAAPVADSSKTVIFATFASAPNIASAGDYVFRNRMSGQLEVLEMAAIMYNQFNQRRVAVIVVNSAFGVGYRDVFKTRFEELGGEVSLTEAFPQGQTDFRSLITKLDEVDNLDGIYLVAHVAECAYLFRQSKELGFYPKWFSTVAIEGPELFEIAGDASEGVLYTAELYDPESSDSRNFALSYRERFGEDSQLFSANGYEAIKIVADVLRKADYEGEAIKDSLYTIRHEGIKGLTTFDQNGEIIRPIGVYIVRDRGYKLYREVDRTSSD